MKITVETTVNIHPRKKGLKNIKPMASKYTAKRLRALLDCVVAPQMGDPALGDAIAGYAWVKEWIDMLESDQYRERRQLATAKSKAAQTAKKTRS